jgi:hypothetical protein
MIIGDKEHFGIQCDIRRAEGHIVIGDLWLWGEDLRIGDEVSAVDIPLVLAHLASPLYVRGQRHIAFLDSLSEEQIADFLYRFVYSDDSFNEEETAIGHFCYEHLTISAFNLEGFDSALVVLLGRDDGGDRLIWKRKDDGAAHEVLLKCGEYESVLVSCLDYVEGQTGYRAKERARFAPRDFK